MFAGNDQCRFGAIFYDNLAHAIGSDTIGGVCRGRIAKERILIRERRQGNIGNVKGIAQDLLGCLGVFPQAWTIIGIKDDTRALAACVANRIQDVLTAFRAQNAHGNTGKINDLAAIETFRQCFRIIGKVTGGGIIAPIGEGTLTPVSVMA